MFEILVFSQYLGVISGQFWTLFEKLATFGPKRANKIGMKTKNQKSDKHKLLVFL